ncbi:winged helix DNA-binding domain-containing protein [Streptacidiphilus monticola]|uniref:Winged helix DNA-binding domain-containing protein n=1 Tax=Streptacidiphilus monticola TaxID=2161674 RepID=A0ABW1G402_9ACTN
MKPITDAQRRARLGMRQLSIRAGHPREVADALVGLHGTDPATVYLSLGARLAAPSPAAVEAALYDEVSLVRLLAMRRTLFVVPDDLAAVVDSSSAHAVAARERRQALTFLAENGGWDESRLQAVCAETLDALRTLGAATGAELAAAVPALAEQFTVAAGKPYEAKQSAGSRVIRLLSCDNLIRRDRPKGGWTSSAYRWTPSEPFPQLPPADAKSELVRRWLASYGPGTEADLKWWTGWSLGDVRRALAAVGAEPVALDSGAQGFLLPGDDETVDAAPTAALLPALDPTAMGWQERDWYLDPDLKPQLFDRTGNIGPTVWWAGRVVGGWGQRPDGSVAWELLAPVPAPGRRAVAAEAERLTAFLGGVRVTPRFRTPLERRLAEPARPAPGNL